MGKTLQELASIELPDREAHHSRCLMDLSENVHLHHRDWRQEFTVDEFYEFAAVVTHAARELRMYLAQNPDYREQAVHRTIFVAGGDDRLYGLLENSPQPNRSHYWPHNARVELLDPSMRDEIHVHIRDHRVNMPRTDFRALCRLFREAEAELDWWEDRHEYRERAERTRTMDEERERVARKARRPCAVVELPTDSIGSREPDHTRDTAWQQELAKRIAEGEAPFPLLVSTEPDGSHRVIDGEHRLAACKLAGRPTVPCVVADMTFEESARFRALEGQFKKLDRATGWRYNLTGANREFVAYRLNRHYAGHFRKAAAGTL